MSLKEAWSICLEALEIFKDDQEFELISFVMMNNHYHMIARIPYFKLRQKIQRFHKKMEPKLFFDRDFHLEPIFSRRYLEHCYRYIYQNPLRAKITNRCEYYPYSTLHTLCAKSKFPLTIYDRCGFKDEYGLEWLNKRSYSQTPSKRS